MPAQWMTASTGPGSASTAAATASVSERSTIGALDRLGAVGRDRLEAVGVDVPERQPGALAGEDLRRRQADAAGGAGDEDEAAAEARVEHQ